MLYRGRGRGRGRGGGGGALRTFQGNVEIRPTPTLHTTRLEGQFPELASRLDRRGSVDGHTTCQYSPLNGGGLG